MKVAEDSVPKAALARASHEEIAVRAYEKFVARGGEDGRDLEDWFRAESELTNSRADVAVDARANVRKGAKTRAAS